MLKSIVLSVTVGVVVGLGLSFRGWVKGIAVDLNSTLAICGFSMLACFLLSFRDHFQAKSNADDRELKELEDSSDPLLEVVNAEQHLSFKRRFGSASFDSFEVTWVVNQTTMDLNTSILSVRMVKPIRSKDAKREINQIAQHYCGGHFCERKRWV